LPGNAFEGATCGSSNRNETRPVWMLELPGAATAGGGWGVLAGVGAN